MVYTFCTYLLRRDIYAKGPLSNTRVHFQLGFLLFYSTLQCISLQLKQSSSLRNKP